MQRKIISFILLFAFMFSIFISNDNFVFAKTKSISKVEKLFKNNNLPTSEKEMKKYLKMVKVKVFIIKKNKKKDKLVKKTVKILIHKKLTSKFKSAFNKMYKLKFPIERTLIKNNFYNGCYCWRNVRNNNSRSLHSYGVDCDINPNDGTNPKSKYYISNKIVKIWKKLGFSWGGDWSSYKDSIHFEYN